MRFSSCQILGVSNGSLESQAILFKYLHQWAADQMHMCQRKTRKCIHEADVVKIMLGKGIEKILMDLRQFLYRNLEA